MCCYSWVAPQWFPQPEPRSNEAGWAENSTRAGTCHSSSRGGCKGPWGLSCFSHCGRKGHCTRAAFHSKGIALPRWPCQPSPSLRENQYQMKPGWPRAPARLRPAPSAFADGKIHIAFLGKRHRWQPRRDSQSSLHMCLSAEAAAKAAQLRPHAAASIQFLQQTQKLAPQTFGNRIQSAIVTPWTTR